jgi:3-phosphoshikimate 1-carboxyvinyltransferase
VTIITPQFLSGTLSIPSSKSLSHRYVLAASLAEGKSEILNILESDDLDYTKQALINLGVKIEKTSITGGHLSVKSHVIDCGESGSTLRFLIPVAMLLKDEITFVGRGKLETRPLSVYDDIFSKHYTFKHPKDKSLPLTVKGPLKANTYYLKGNVSSQFITGLLYALPLTRGQSKLILTTELESKGYVDLTIDCLKKFGIEIIQDKYGFFIPGNQKYQPRKLSVEADYSSAAFFIVAATLGGEITLKGLNKHSLQGDKKIVEIVNQMGGKVVFVNDDLVIQKAKTKGTTIDLKNIPDLGPILMLLASVSEGLTTFKNISRLRLKESDRLEAMMNNLQSLGVSMRLENEETLIIMGRQTLTPTKPVSAYNDHRIAMTMAVASLKSDTPIVIDDMSVVKKSYPNFVRDFIHLGGKIHE